MRILDGRKNKMLGPRISIITAYYNRKKAFRETLKSINRSQFKDFELVAVDDGSSESERIEDLTKEYPFLRVIRQNPEDKWYFNPCIPFNIGIDASRGEIIVLQDAECFHLHDVLSYINKNITDKDYLSISTYATDPQKTDRIVSLEGKEAFDYFESLPKERDTKSYINCWYNHSTYPMFYHYCSAITKRNMDKLGGFDERFALGFACDDDEFIIRIERLGLNKKIIDEISVIHQSHPVFFHYHPKFNELVAKNRRILIEMKTGENGYKAIRVNSKGETKL